MAYLIVNRAYRITGNTATSLDAAFTDAVAGNTLSSFFPVVPTSRRARHLQRLMIRALFGQFAKPVEPPPISNLEQLALRIFRLTPHAGTRRIISDAYRLALFEEAAESAELRFFRRKGDQLSPAALQRLASVIFGLKEDGIKPENLLSDIERATGSDRHGLADGEEIDVAKLSDLAALFGSYEQLLGSSLADKPVVLRLATEALAESREQPTQSFFAPDSVVFFDGFTEFKQPEVEFLAALGGVDVPVALRLDYSLDNGPLFGNLSVTLEHLVSEGFTIIKLDDVPVFSDDVPAGSRVFSPLGAYLRRWLFNTERQIFHPGFSRCVSILAANDRNDEVLAIAKLVRFLTIENNIPPADICIAARQIDRYSDIVRELFTAHDIPVNVTDRFPLAKSPVTVAVFSVLDMILSGFRRQDVHRALQNPYLKFSRDDGAAAIDGANLYAAAQRLRVLGGQRYGGRKAWEKSLKLDEERIARRIERLTADPYSDPRDIANAGRELLSTKRAAEDFSQLCETLPEAGMKALPSDFAAMIKRSVIEKFRIRDSVTAFFEQVRCANFPSQSERNHVLAEVEKDARALSSLLEILDEIAGIQEQRFGLRTMTLEQFTDKFRIAVTAAKYQIREKSGWGVTLTTLEQTRGIPFRVLICCGMNDGEFPGVYIPDSFLGKELPDTEDRFIRAERMQFYQAITGLIEREDDAERHLYLTYCTRKGDEQIVRSPFIDALLKISTLEGDGEVFSLTELRNPARATTETTAQQLQKIPWLNAVTSFTELLKYPEFTGIDSPYFSEISEYARIVRNMPSERTLLEDLPEDVGRTLTAAAERPFSVSELETFSACPYKYFSERLLRLNERKELEGGLSSLERGNLLHVIVYRFFRRIQSDMLAAGEFTPLDGQSGESRQPLAPVRLMSGRLEQYREILREIAVEELAAIRYQHPFFDMEQQLLLGGDGRKGDVDRWLEAELDSITAATGFLPALFEIGFGSKAAGGAVSPAVELPGGLLLQGKIDRLEVSAKGDAFIVADYKSGNTLTANKDIQSGRSFQMPLYLLAAQKILAELYGLESSYSAAVYYRLRPLFDKKKKSVNSGQFVLLPKNSPIVAMKNLVRNTAQVVADESERDAIIAQSATTASENVTSISQGKFPVSPAEKSVCEYCSFPSVCRIKEAEEL